MHMRKIRGDFELQLHVVGAGELRRDKKPESGEGVLNEA